MSETSNEARQLDSAGMKVQRQPNRDEPLIEGGSRELPNPLSIDPEPAGSSIFKQMLLTLAFNVALPILVFNLLTKCGVSTLCALIAGGLGPAIDNIRAWVKSRRLEPLGIIVMAFIALGAAASLISGSVFFTQIKESFLTAAFGLVCLGSLLIGRPLMFYLMRPFVAGNDPERLIWWNSLWQYPRFRAALRLVTAVWGLGYLVEALLRVGFALALSPAQVVVISPVMAFGALIALMAWTRRYMLAFRQRSVREQNYKRQSA